MSVDDVTLLFAVRIAILKELPAASGCDSLEDRSIRRRMGHDDIDQRFHIKVTFMATPHAVPRLNSALLALLACLMTLPIAGCGSEYEPTADELSAANSIRNMGGQITMRGKKHVEIYLVGTKISDGDLPMLELFPHLELLNLQNTGITNEGARHVGRLKSLQRLTLQRTKVTDDGLVHIGELKSLVELDLVGLPITDAGLEHLHGLTKLEKLYYDSKQVSTAGVQSLQDALPRAKILAD